MTLFFILFISFFSTASHAAITSMSSAVFDQRKSDAYWVVDFTCTGSDSKISMEQGMLGDTWCLADVDGVCAETKQDLANQACESEFIQASANGTIGREAPVTIQEPDSQQQDEKAKEQAQRAQAAADAKEAQLRAEQRDLQRELSKLEQERSSLLQDEVTLDEQAAGIQAELDSTAN